MDYNDITCISFSGGRFSAMMTEILLENIPPDDRIICFCNTGKEMEQTLEFVRDCENHWGEKVYWLEYDPDVEKMFVEVDFETASRKGEPFEKLIRKKKYLPNPIARFCTAELKVCTMRRFLVDLGFEHWTNAVGLRYDEPERVRKLRTASERERWEVDTPLYDMKITEFQVNQYFKDKPYDLKLKPYQGNCDLCFLKGKNKKSQIIREDRSSADWWVRMEEEVGATFRPNYSYQSVVTLIETQPLLFDLGVDDEIDCFCGVI